MLFRSAKHTISTERFFYKEKINAVKNRLKGLTDLKNSLLLESELQLAKAKEAHDNIEKTYITAMDFDLLNKFTDNFITKILR